VVLAQIGEKKLTIETIWEQLELYTNQSKRIIKYDLPQCYPSEAPPPKIEFHVTGVDRLSVSSIHLSIIPDPIYEVLINNEIYGQLSFFGPRLNQPIAAPVVISDPADGCSLTNKYFHNPYEGNIVIMKRGNCLFADKVLNAQIKKAIAVIIYNTDNDEVFVMGTIQDAEQYKDTIKIPAMMVTRTAGQNLLKFLKSSPYNNMHIAPLIRDPLIPSNSTLQLTLMTRQGLKKSKINNVNWGHSYAFVNEDSIIFSLDSLGVDYNNRNMEIQFLSSEDIDFYRHSPIKSNENFIYPSTTSNNLLAVK